MAKTVALSGGDDGFFVLRWYLCVDFTGTSILLYGWALLEECQVSKNGRIADGNRSHETANHMYNCGSGLCYHTPTQVSET